MKKTLSVSSTSASGASLSDHLSVTPSTASASIALPAMPMVPAPIIQTEPSIQVDTGNIQDGVRSILIPSGNADRLGPPPGAGTASSQVSSAVVGSEPITPTHHAFRKAWETLILNDLFWESQIQQARQGVRPAADQRIKLKLDRTLSTTALDEMVDQCYELKPNELSTPYKREKQHYYTAMHALITLPQYMEKEEKEDGISLMGTPTSGQQDVAPLSPLPQPSRKREEATEFVRTWIQKDVEKGYHLANATYEYWIEEWLEAPNSTDWKTLVESRRALTLNIQPGCFSKDVEKDFFGLVYAVSLESEATSRALVDKWNSEEQAYFQQLTLWLQEIIKNIQTLSNVSVVAAIKKLAKEHRGALDKLTAQNTDLEAAVKPFLVDAERDDLKRRLNELVPEISSVLNKNKQLSDALLSVQARAESNANEIGTIMDQILSLLKHQRSERQEEELRGYVDILSEIKTQLASLVADRK